MCDANKKASVRAYYDVYADVYDKRYENVQTPKYVLAFSLIRGVNADFAVVGDIGCGTGSLSRMLKDIARHVICVDISGRMLEVALKKAKGENVHFICADADHLPLREGVFTLVFSITLLQNMPDPVQTLVEMSRACRRGAYLLISSLRKQTDAGALLRIFRAANVSVTAIIDDPHVEDVVVLGQKVGTSS